MAVFESRPAVPAVLYDVAEAAEALRLSRSVLYELIRSGRLRTVKQGRRRLVPVSALAEYVDSLGGRARLVVPAGTAGCSGISTGTRTVQEIRAGGIQVIGPERCTPRTSVETG
jgi:excisionase family DNA binding protein